MTKTVFDTSKAEEMLATSFAPWVQDLNISFDKVAGGQAVLRIPPSERLYRSGGSYCGQAIMALADTAMVFAIASAHEGFLPMTTVAQSTSFLRAASDADLIADATIIKLGRTLVYGEINVYTDSPDKAVAHITSTNMLLQG